MRKRTLESSRVDAPQLRCAWALFKACVAVRDGWPRPLRLVALPVVAGIYRFVSLSLVGMDIPSSTRLSTSARIYHGVGLVVHAEAVIEAGVVLRHNTTIGKSSPDLGAPVIRRDSQIGPNSVILGPIEIGRTPLLVPGRSW